MSPLRFGRFGGLAATFEPTHMRGTAEQARAGPEMSDLAVQATASSMHLRSACGPAALRLSGEG
jgi:hypothetical protein